ncbi:hypothetical protein AMTRI_Chr08g208420 [Amborella trichopoda]
MAPPPVALANPSRWIQVSRSRGTSGLLNGPSSHRKAHTLPRDLSGVTYPLPQGRCMFTYVPAILLNPNQSPLRSTDGSLASAQPPSSSVIPPLCATYPSTALVDPRPHLHQPSPTTQCHVIVHEPVDPLPYPSSVRGSALAAPHHATASLSSVSRCGKSSLADLSSRLNNLFYSWASRRATHGSLPIGSSQATLPRAHL